MITTLLALALAAAPAPGSHEALWALMDEEWNWSMESYPEWATDVGDNRFNDRLTDLSTEALAKRQQHERAMLARAQAFDRSHLSAEDRLNLDLMIYPLQVEVDGYRFPEELFQIDQLNSPPSDLARLASKFPREHVKDYEDFLIRMGKIAPYIDQVMALLKQGLAKGITPPQVTLVELPKLIGNHCQADPTQTPLYQVAFGEIKGIPETEQTRLRAQAKQLLTTQVLPAYHRLLTFVTDTYLPGARRSLGMNALPDGAAWYRQRIRAATTTAMSAEEIHALGLSEVARLDKELDRIRAEAGFQGDREAFFHFLKTDPRFFLTDQGALLRQYRDIAKRIDHELPHHFRTLPRLPYGVEPMPAYQEKTSPAAYYEPGSPEAGRAGTFMANTYDLSARPTWAMEDLTLHEAVPGHHLQIARAQELDQLPMLRRNQFYTAYTEGWGLYAESLGDELGLYRDPYSRFGQVSAEMWRAVRLVVDTGLHAKGWTRDQAIAFFRDHTGQSDLNVKVEVDRYIVWPGQALGYKLGELDLKRLRARASAQLGERFDERDFHDAILGQGALPLPVLDTRIEEWIATQKQHPAR